MEIAPDLTFRHYTLREVPLPTEAFVKLEGVPLDEVNICCDLDTHVYNPHHTEPQIVASLQGTHWIDVGELAGPPAAA